MATSILNWLGEQGGQSRDALESQLSWKSKVFKGVQPLGHLKGNWDHVVTKDDLMNVGQNFIYTEIDGGTSAVAGVVQAPTASVGPVLKITTSGSQHDGAQIQHARALTGSATAADTKVAFTSVIPRAGNNIIFYTRFRISTTIANSAFVFGLCPVDTTMIATSAIGVTDLLGFYKAASATCGGVMRASSTSTTTALNGGFTPTVNTWHEVGLSLNGVSGITYWVDGKMNNSNTVTNIPTVALCPSLAFVGATAAAATIEIADLYCGQEAY